MKWLKFTKLAAAVAAGSLLAAHAHAAGRLVVYCSATNAMCENAVQQFSKKHDVKASFIRNGSGSTFAKVEEVKGNATSAIYMGILGFGVNTERLQKLGIKEVPKCWKDLTKPEYKGEVQIADPQSAGTAYTALATFVQLWGEDEAFSYFKQLHPNISQYTKSGVTPSRNAARGETAIGIGFLHDYTLEKNKGAPLELVVPCEGTGYELGGVSILKGARNLDNAKLFVDWALSKEGQESAWQHGESLQILTNTTAEQAPNTPDPAKLKLIDYDFAKYGSADERKRLIDKWVETVKLAK